MLGFKGFITTVLDTGVSYVFDEENNGDEKKAEVGRTEKKVIETTGETVFTPQACEKRDVRDDEGGTEAVEGSVTCPYCMGTGRQLGRYPCGACVGKGVL